MPKTQPADPAFPKGYAIRGRDVMRTRTVTANGAVLHEDTFYSQYAPVWGGPAPRVRRSRFAERGRDHSAAVTAERACAARAVAAIAPR